VKGIMWKVKVEIISRDHCGRTALRLYLNWYW